MMRSPAPCSRLAAHIDEIKRDKRPNNQKGYGEKIRTCCDTNGTVVLGGMASKRCSECANCGVGVGSPGRVLGDRVARRVGRQAGWTGPIESTLRRKNFPTRWAGVAVRRPKHICATGNNGQSAGLCRACKWQGSSVLPVILEKSATALLTEYPAAPCNSTTWQSSGLPLLHLRPFETSVRGQSNTLVGLLTSGRAARGVW